MSIAAANQHLHRVLSDAAVLRERVTVWHGPGKLWVSYSAPGARPIFPLGSSSLPEKRAFWRILYWAMPHPSAHCVAVLTPVKGKPSTWGYLDTDADYSRGVRFQW